MVTSLLRMLQAIFKSVDVQSKGEQREIAKRWEKGSVLITLSSTNKSVSSSVTGQAAYRQKLFVSRNKQWLNDLSLQSNWRRNTLLTCNSVVFTSQLPYFYLSSIDNERGKEVCSLSRRFFIYLARSYFSNSSKSVSGSQKILSFNSPFPECVRAFFKSPAVNTKCCLHEHEGLDRLGFMIWKASLLTLLTHQHRKHYWR